jgi:hypothetical protein
LQADLPARATLIDDTDAKRAILKHICDNVGRFGDLEAWVAHSLLVEMTFDAANS